MCRRQRLLKWNVLLLAFILKTFFQQTFSDKSGPMCDYDWKSIEALHGHVVSMRFHLTLPILENHSIVWIIPNNGSMRCDRFLQCTSNDSSIITRYRLLKAFENNTFEALIEPAQEQDSGQHIIIAYEGRDQTCTPLIFQLTVVKMYSKCSTWLDKEEVKIQMTCQWTQVRENDRAGLRAGKKVLSEDRTPDNNFRGNFDLTHQFGVYIDIQDIDAVEYVCVVLRGKSNESEKCYFLTAQYQAIHYSQSEHKLLQCCATNEDMSATWWNSASGDLLPFTSNSITRNIAFLCIEKTNSSKATIYKILVVDIQQRGYDNELTLAKSPPKNKQHKNSTDELRCEVIISVNKIMTFPSSTDFKTGGFSNIPTITSDLVQTTDSKTSSVSVQTVLISVTAIATSFVFSFSSIFIILCYYNYIRKDKYQLNQTRSTDLLTSLAAEEEDASESRSHEITSFSSHTPQPSNVHEAVSDQVSASLDSSCSGRVTMQSNNAELGKHRNLPVLCEMEDSSPAVSSSIPNVPHGSGFVEEGCLDDKGVGQQHVGNPLLTPTYQENAYSSVDDLKDLTIFTKEENQPSKPTTFLEPLQSPYIHDGKCPDGDKIINSSSLTDNPKAKDINVDMGAGNLTQPSVELEAMYAQPDMSRKTKTKGKTLQPVSQMSLEGVCAHGPSDSTEDAFLNNPSTSNHLYSSVPTNMYCNDNTEGIFESTCEGDLYMNSSVHRFE